MGISIDGATTPPGFVAEMVKVIDQKENSLLDEIQEDLLNNNKPSILGIQKSPNPGLNKQAGNVISSNPGLKKQPTNVISSNPGLSKETNLVSCPNPGLNKQKNNVIVQSNPDPESPRLVPTTIRTTVPVIKEEPIVLRKPESFKSKECQET